MRKVTIVGKDWGFFASALTKDLENRGFAVVRRFNPNDALSITAAPAAHRTVSDLRRAYNMIDKPLFVHSILRELASCISAIWWATGIRGSEVIVVSSIPSVFQSKFFLGLCRLLGKQTLLCVHGSDGRPPFLNGLSADQLSSRSGKSLARYLRRFMRKINLASRKSTKVVSWMGCSHYLPGETFLFEEVGFPILDQGISFTSMPVYGNEKRNHCGAKIRILHAPSSAGKGSAEIRRIIEELVSEGYPIDFKQVDGMPNIQVLEAIADSDLVLDQLYSDNFSGVLAREAASMLRWVIVGGSSLKEMKETAIELPPVLNSSAGELKNDLISCLNNLGHVRQQAEALQKHFLERNFADFFVSTFFLSEHAGPSPSSFHSRTPFVDFHPGFGGYGGEEEIRQMIQAVLRSTGISGLGFQENYSLSLLAHYGIQTR